MFKKFTRYIHVGVWVTAVHALVFAICVYFLSQQAISNLIAFIVAASCSYLLNTRYTFKKNFHVYRYFMFLCFMGAISYSVGYSGDFFRLHWFVTLILSALASLIIGFVVSHFIIFNFEDKK